MGMRGASYDEFVAANRIWGRGDFEDLVRCVRQFRVDGELVAVDTDGWLGLRCRAVDAGRPDLVLDAVQLEGLIDRIEDHRVRAAVVLAMHGFEDADIGMLLGGRGRSRTGTGLVGEGIRVMEGFGRGVG